MVPPLAPLSANVKSLFLRWFVTRSSLGLRSRVWPQMMIAIVLFWGGSGSGPVVTGGDEEGGVGCGV